MQIIFENPVVIENINLIEKNIPLSFDLETSGLDQFEDGFKIKCLTLSFNGEQGYYLPFEKINKRLLRKFFSNKYNITAAGKYDIKCLEVKGVKGVVVDEDVTLLYHLLNIDRKSNSIKSLSWLIGLGWYDNELVEFIKKYKITDYTQIPDNILMPYAVMDSIVTYRLYTFAKRNLVPRQKKVYSVYKKYLIPTLTVFKDMEIGGMLVDTEYLNKFNNEIENKLKDLRIEICNELGDIDLNSSQQLARVLEDKGYEDIGRTGKSFYTNDKGEQVRYYSTGEKYLKKWKKLGHPVMELLLDYRAIQKLKTTYLGNVDDQDTEEQENYFEQEQVDNKLIGIAKYIRSGSIIHCVFNPARTNSFRTSCVNPNLQNQLHEGEYAKKYRQIFIAPEDYLFFEADYSGFHLRIVAIMSGEPRMCEIFKNDGDMHSITACSIFCRGMQIEDFIQVKHEEPYKSYRSKAKRINFRFIYGGQARNFTEVLEEEWSDTEVYNYIKENDLAIIGVKEEKPDVYLTVAVDIRKKFFETYPGLFGWYKKCYNFAIRNGFVESIQGIRRHLPDLMCVGEEENSELLNKAVNSPVQGFEAAYVYKALDDVYTEFKKNNMRSKLIATVHDSLAGYVHREEMKQVAMICKEKMEDINNWDIPILIDVSMGNVWGFSDELNFSTLNESIAEIKEKYFRD